MWRRRFASVSFTLFLFLMLSRVTYAQTITTGLLSGTVSNEASGLLADVSITVTADDGGATRTVITEHNGAFQFAALLPGLYSVLVERLGYKPKLIEQVPVRTGRAVRLDVSLTPAPPPIEAPERVRFEGDVGGSRAGISQSLSELSLDQLPWSRRETSELGLLSSTSTEALETEGLPSWLSTVRIDGLPYVTARHPLLGREAQREIALPVSMLQSAELVTGDADGEWSGFAGGTLAANTRRGANDFTLQSFGSWSGGALHDSKFIEDGSVSNSSLWGGLLMSGPIIRDTAHFVIGLEARKLETPFPRAWERAANIDAALVDVGHDSFDVNLEQYVRPFVVQSDVVSAFGRFDWQVAADNAMSLRFGWGHVSPTAGDADVAAATVPEMTGTGNDLFLSAALQSKIASKWAHEVRVGLLRSTRDYEADEAGDILPSTRIVQGGLRFGTDARLPGFFKRTEVNLDQSLQILNSTHQLKVGVDVGMVWHDDDYSFASAGDFVFSGPAEFAQTQGVFVETSLLDALDLKFNVVKLGVFVQDVWNAAPGLRLTATMRYDGTTLPKKDIEFNDGWFTATGIPNNGIKDRINAYSPRFSLQWTGRDGAWVVNASAGRYAADVDADVINELLLKDRDLALTRTAGDLGRWPTPLRNNLPDDRRTLAVPGPDFRAPQTDRAALGVSQRIGSATLHVSGAYRSTEFLTRRSDLNLFTTPSAHDQNGRPVFGSLVQLGELVTVAQPNRRFTNYDLVSALTADGWSRYWGITAGVEHDASTSLSFFANYTYSRTEDNWLTGRVGGGPEAQLSPFPDDDADAWREGTSDFDLPHRLSAGFELRPGGALQPRLTAIYRFRSGYPFTPGFRDGVDVNGDGSGRNDPAFVDDGIAGVSELISSWDCLRDQVGNFAERNACRESSVHSLNLRVGLTLLHGSRTSAEVFVDGINLIESAQAEPDRALYLIDGSRNLVENQGTVTVPLVVNPHFGKPLVRFGTGRMLRIGLQVKH